MKKIKKNRCVQCLKILEWQYMANSLILMFYCSYPECPNYKLYQKGDDL